MMKLPWLTLLLFNISLLDTISVFVSGQEVVGDNSEGNSNSNSDVRLLLLDGPKELWSKSLTPILAFNDVGVRKNNGITITPDGSLAIITTHGAEIYAIDPYTGTQKWSYRPPPAKTIPTVTSTRCHSSVSMLSSRFLVYTVIDDEANADIDDTVSRVVALDWTTGQELWISELLDGVAQGDPLISTDGRYVFLVHNTARETQGFFTILSTHETPGHQTQPGKSLYSEFTGTVGEDSVAFGPPALYRKPTRGNYDPYDGGDNGDPAKSQGDNNSNDFIMWGQTPKPADYASNEVQDGCMYGFQFPRGFNSTDVNAATAALNNYEVTIFQLGRQIRDFQVTTPPVMTNDGQIAYWGVARSGFRGWTNRKFSRVRNAVDGFARNSDFPGQPVFATPAVSHGSDSSQPVVFGGTSSNEFVRLNHDFSESVVVKTNSLIKSRAVVDVNDRAVYYVEEDGTLHQVDFDLLTDTWTHSVVSSTSDSNVHGEMTLTPAGDVLLVADTSGTVKGLQVSEMSSTAIEAGVSRDNGKKMRSLLRA
mmetsp:Transcript_39729/g.95869  ORF Transcript_39729/g.95869 Transcript_39729/m.95869 type:complete len:535 (+) Transcript_39729:175-1779(+)